MNATLPLFATQQTKQFHFEGNLQHQQDAVSSILAVLDGLPNVALPIITASTPYLSKHSFALSGVVTSPFPMIGI